MSEVVRGEYLELLDEFRSDSKLIKIITGVRRSGKSTILIQFRDRLLDDGENVVHLDMEGMAYSITTDREMMSYITENMGGGKGFVLIDEVQMVDGWEKVVNTLRANGANVYVTGSNAKILSSEFTTIIGGRYVEIHILPLSFREFLRRYPPRGTERTEQRFSQFLKEGGLPIIDLETDSPRKRRVILDGVIDSIVGRDIHARSGLDGALIKRLTSFMFFNIGNVVTGESLLKGSGISDRRTLDKYLDAVEDSYVFYRVDSYDLIGKRMMKVKAKYYSADVGLRNVTIGHRADDSAGLLENVVFLELLRRGYDVTVGSYRDYEVDFTARRGEHVEFYQISATLSGDSTIKREERPLKLLKDEGSRYILTLDRDLPAGSKGITYMNLIDWLLTPPGEDGAGGESDDTAGP